MSNLALYAGGLGELETACHKILTPAPDMPVYQWLEENCYVRGDNEGKYSTNRTPYVREPLDCFSDKSIESLTLCWGTQTSKTTIMMGGVAWRLVNDPQDTLWVLPDKDLAASFSRNRWQPWVEDCEPLRDIKPDDLRKYTTLEQPFSRSTLYFVGSNSPSQVSSRPCGLIAMDEADKFGVRTEREAGAMENAEERSTSFNYPLHVKTSTPTVFYGSIWQEFLLGDQRYYYVPCPRCSGFIKFTWKQIKWHRNPDGSDSKTDGDWDFQKVRRNTFYLCQECGGEIRDHEKADMLMRGEWRPENPAAARERRSYHLNSLYSPWKKVRWPNLAVQWLQARASLTRRHRFINSKLAEIWDGENAYDDDPIKFMPYISADLPAERTPIMTIDVQDDANHFWFVVRSWSPTGESWLEDCGRIESMLEIQALQGKYKIEANNVVFDIAHKTGLICRWLVDNDWRGMWGSDKKSFAWKLDNGQTAYRSISMPKQRDPHLGTALQNERNPTAIYIEWGNEPIKDMLAILRDGDPARFHINATVPVEYVKHANAEKKVGVQNVRTGRWSSMWKQLKKANHLNDCECMQIAAALIRGVITDDHFDYANAQGALKLTTLEKKG